MDITLKWKEKKKDIKEKNERRSPEMPDNNEIDLIIQSISRGATVPIFAEL